MPERLYNAAQQIAMSPAELQTLLAASPDAAFEMVAKVARELIAAPIAAVNLIEGDRFWVKAGYGMPKQPLPRAEAFCDVTVGSDAPLVVDDAATDPRFRSLAVVTAADPVRFYAGVPLHVTDRVRQVTEAVGTLCVMDVTPRSLPPGALAVLRQLGDILGKIIEAEVATAGAVAIARTAAEQSQQLRRQDLTFRQAERLARIGSWWFSLETDETLWSEGMYRIYELPPTTALSVDEAIGFFSGISRPDLAALVEKTSQTGEPFTLELDFVTAKGNHRRVRSIAHVEFEEGRATGVSGVMQDITEHWLLEEKLRRSADTDFLTDIANRSAFNRALSEAIERARSTPAPFALMLIDLDEFKGINDTHGHIVGDDMLRAVGARLRDPVLGDSLAARLGGDEFALIVTDPVLYADLPGAAEQLLERLRQPVTTAAGVLPISATIGYARFEDCPESARGFIHCADKALYEAKRERRGSARGYRTFGRRSSDQPAG
ncbi:diguanylate cyclase domain-containing protein [Sphingomonas desiccabilis]|uniref:Diguanylate cyclase n=1 Tax=Sphingomonas desiccabilis TaxID=429134 RepID=A0A4Q2IYB6_9SPHN|nr:diguanylate cyclase [Sphingomonas desiccabilis]MBB3909596.1 diguanylate cyclase (GGDEF)-like protein [Sphingomonas desiccabilis]RXZ34310.1 diguanylate cyclase [Sphingomonas desiccabilis]